MLFENLAVLPILMHSLGMVKHKRCCLEHAWFVQFLMCSPMIFCTTLHLCSNTRYPLNREGAIKVVIDALREHDVIVGTTGMLSRELFEYRVTKGQGHEKDFLTVGSMGHASAIALGISKFQHKRQVTLLHNSMWSSEGPPPVSPREGASIGGGEARDV